MHLITKPTMNHIDRPSKPFSQSIIDDAGKAHRSSRTETSAPDSENRQHANSANDTANIHVPDAEETAREYCRRRNAGKWGLRKV